MPSKQTELVTAKLKEIFGEVPEDLKKRILETEAGHEAFIRGVAMQIDSHELLILIAAETGSPVMVTDMSKLARDVTNELLKSTEDTV